MKTLFYRKRFFLEGARFNSLRCEESAFRVSTQLTGTTQNPHRDDKESGLLPGVPRKVERLGKKNLPPSEATRVGTRRSGRRKREP